MTANDKLSTFTVDHDNGITTVINNSTVIDEMTFTAEFTAKIVINGTEFATKAFTFNVIVDKCKEDTQTAFYSTSDIDIQIRQLERAFTVPSWTYTSQCDVVPQTHNQKVAFYSIDSSSGAETLIGETYLNGAVGATPLGVTVDISNLEVTIETTKDHAS